MNTTTKHSFAQRRDVYQEVTDYIIAALEKGDIVWKKPWNTYGLPKNIAEGNQYRGYNIFFLNFVCQIKNYKAPYFLTFLQAQKLGGRIKKGERGHPIVHWFIKEDKTKTVIVADESTGEQKEVPRLKRVPRFHTVFNIEQTEGIAFPKLDNIERTMVEKLEACEQVIERMPDKPTIVHRGERACYVPSIDEVRMPAQTLFHSDEEYYCTLFHELAHSTGHPKRLNREELRKFTVFGDNEYSKEELTAELTAAFLSAITGIQQKTLDNSAAYLQGWLKALKDDKRLFLKASTQAQAAADFILNVKAKTQIQEAENTPQLEYVND